jgi:hypothetical protein
MDTDFAYIHAEFQHGHKGGCCLTVLDSIGKTSYPLCVLKIATVF